MRSFWIYMKPDSVLIKSCLEFQLSNDFARKAEKSLLRHKTKLRKVLGADRDEECEQWFFIRNEIELSSFVDSSQKFIQSKSLDIAWVAMNDEDTFYENFSSSVFTFLFSIISTWYECESDRCHNKQKLGHVSYLEMKSIIHEPAETDDDIVGWLEQMLGWEKL